MVVIITTIIVVIIVIQLVYVHTYVCTYVCNVMYVPSYNFALLSNRFMYRMLYVIIICT